MERIKNLGGYQKFILLTLIVMVIVFAVSYFVTTSRVGFAYADTILLPTYEENQTVYSGRIGSTQATFTVTADQAVTFTYGTKTYGPYTVTEDPTAVPASVSHATGIELRNGDKLVFRGGISDTNLGLTLYEKDGSIRFLSFSSYSFDSMGNILNPEPSAHTILRLMDGPKLTHKGEWGYWFLCVFMSVIVAVSVLFPDELFRLRLIFRVRDVDSVEPSDWEITGRYIGWTVSAIAILVVYVMGLQ